MPMKFTKLEKSPTHWQQLMRDETYDKKKTLKDWAGILEECERLNNEDKVDVKYLQTSRLSSIYLRKCQMTRLKEIVFDFIHTWFTPRPIRSSERRTKSAEGTNLIYRGMLNDVEQIYVDYTST